MKLPYVPLPLAVLVSVQSFFICLFGYYLSDDRDAVIGICACMFAVMSIWGLFLLPTKKPRS